MGTEIKTALLIGSAPGPGLDYLGPYLTGGELVICADGGVKRAMEARLDPDCYVGDSDSGGFLPEGLDRWLLPSEKNLTDLEMAVEKALEAGAKRVLLCGCTGGRQDHHLANLFLLEQLCQRGAKGMILDELNEITYLPPGSYLLENRPRYHYFSLLPVEKVLGQLTISGSKYELPPTDVPRGSTLSVSNEFVGDRPVKLSFSTGSAFLIRSVPEN